MPNESSELFIIRVRRTSDKLIKRERHMLEDDIQNFISHENVQSGKNIIILESSNHRERRVGPLWKCSYMDC